MALIDDRQSPHYKLNMRMEQLDYDLPQELIAQRPIEPRDRARLLVLHRTSGAIEHHTFAELPELILPGDCLVLNDTRVLAARLLGRREATGGRWEGLFLRELGTGQWELLCQTGGHPRPGEYFAVNGDKARLVLCERRGDGHWLVEPEPRQPVAEFLARYGHVPLPPYVRGGKDEPSDHACYQTVYADRPGAIAAPTAGLHFTDCVIDRIRARGISVVRLTLHVGLGTFLQIRESIESHAMHTEWGELTAAAVERIDQCRANGGRVVAVGTTCVRVLETAARTGELVPWCGETSIFIFPPYRFHCVDALITNFHLPRTTLLALVCAFAGTELTRTAYREAIRQRYRFYSFGDAMLIL
jgi:S-adenosylmethionine:tRNA ribosyltransferase-isomerase